MLNYRKHRSASYIVREWLLWVVVERERERERETPVTSIDITLKSRVIMHTITSKARRPYALTRSEPVECSSACKDKELGAWALEQQGWVIDEDDREGEALRSLVSLSIDAVQTDSLKYECLKVVCNLVEACPSIATRTRAGHRSASLAMGCSAATTSFGFAESCPVVGSAALPTSVSMRWHLPVSPWFNQHLVQLSSCLLGFLVPTSSTTLAVAGVACSWTTCACVAS